MDAKLPEQAAPHEEVGASGTFTPTQRLLAGIALVALLASAAISSWWILDGRADFGNSRGAMPATAEARSAPEQQER